MKLRVRDNSIRLRLTRREVDRMAAEGLVKASVPFSAGLSFDYVLESSRACVDPSAFLSNNVLTVSLPEEKTRQWAASDEVSISAEQALDDGQTLKILVEKDFACLAPRDGEDESDMFDHPEKADAGKRNNEDR